jgi:XTP/dITP diphosphohydrolase
MKLVIASTNTGKLAEVSAALADTPGIDIVSLADIPGIPEIIEDGDTFIANALIKARAVCGITGVPTLADDSGLVVDALDGAPGILSARFAPTTPERNGKLLRLLRDVPDDRRTARFVCAMALVRPDGFEWTTEGTVEGIITRESAGAEGFGYDPLFYYPPLNATFAEIPRDAKNTISHRGHALAAFRDAVAADGILGG